MFIVVIAAGEKTSSWRRAMYQMCPQIKQAEHIWALDAETMKLPTMRQLHMITCAKSTTVYAHRMGSDSSQT